MDMKSLLEKISQISQVTEEEVKVEEAEKPSEESEEAESTEKDDEDKVDEAISIQADGPEATSLLDILKLAGQAPMTQADVTYAEPEMQAEPEMPVAGIEMEVEEEDPTYSNTPDEKVSDISGAVPSGNDMHKEKNQYKHNYRGGDNPMAMEEISKLEGKLKKMFESLKG